LQVEQAVFRADDEVPVFFDFVFHLNGGVGHHAIGQIVERVDGKHGYGKIEAGWLPSLCQVRIGCITVL
jgi:hypothetical protein